VLYKKGHNIEPKGYYIVEISTELTELFVAAFSVVGPESFLIKFMEKEAQ
jgi:hypothetical protein